MSYKVGMQNRLTSLDQAPPEAPPRSRLALRLTLGFGLVCLLGLCLGAIFPPWTNLTALFLARQDRWLLLAGLAVLALASLRLTEKSQPLRPGRAILVLATLIAVSICYFARQAALDGYDMSRDEQMAAFDARIYATSLLAQPLPTFWQTHADALNLGFMLPVARPVAWVSAYLPMNAALRGLVSLFADPALTAPLLVGLGALALWKCARLLWPADREAAVVALLLYFGSGQILLGGMTSYAMPAHLALNLVWLWLFLLDRRGADFGALVVAFVATGLHQPLFHPLFAAPFLVLTLRDRAWPRVMLYGVGYAAICAFWLCWPHVTLGLISGPGSAPPQQGSDYLSRLLLTLFRGDGLRWPNMAANLIRFAAWQSALLPPLMAAGLFFARTERPTLALAACVALPVLAMALLLPYQGHGFGYRYLHGAIGPAILLAVQGWRSLSAEAALLRSLLLRATLGALVLILPLQLAFAHAFYSPFAEVDARIRDSKQDYVVIGAKDAPFAADLVINRADLSNRPIRLLAEYVDDDLLSTICQGGAKVGVSGEALFAGINGYFGGAPTGEAGARLSALTPRMRAAGCALERLDPR
jgi:hypothetical protein